MDENQRPKLRVIRGGAGTTDSGDHANPYGIPRSGYSIPPARRSHPSMGKAFSPKANNELEVPFDKPAPNVDPTKAMVRPKIFTVIKGDKQ